MSKYTEAQGLIKKLYYEEDYCLVPELAEALDLAIEALEIADRLEQADAELHGTILYDLDRTVGIPNRDIFIQGYNQALADIRGDNNDD